MSLPGLDSPEISQAYEDVRSDKSPLAWLILKYASPSSDTLVLDSTGEGGEGGEKVLEEVVSKLGDDEAAYAYLRVRIGNDEYSERVKFVFVVWAGKFGKISRFLFTSRSLGGCSLGPGRGLCVESIDFHVFGEGRCFEKGWRRGFFGAVRGEILRY